VSISPHLNKQISKVRKIVSANAEMNTAELIKIVSQTLKISADKAEELLILSTKEKTSIDEYQSVLESGEGIVDNKLEDKLKYDCLNPEDLMLEQEKQAFAEQLTDNLDDILSYRQAEYVRMYFGIGCAPQTFEQIGEEFCVNAGTVEKGVKSALKKLKEQLE
jgi:RNA polymerase sigma factor (sigma-70 family)